MASRSLESYIGEVFGKHKQLEVVDVDTKAGVGGKRMLYIKCSICSKDHEMFGDGVFTITSGNLNKGIQPCGCGAYQYSPEQMLLRIRRRIVEKGFNLELIGFAEPYRGVDTRLTLRCTVHNTIWNTVDVHVILGSRYKGMCIECEKNFISERRTVDEQLIIENITALKRYPEGSVFWRTPEKRKISLEGHNTGNKWAMTCGICSEDEYVQQGLCSGVFETTAQQLQKGNLPCRCGEHFIYSVEQRRFQIEQHLSSPEKAHYSFVGFHEKNNWQHTSKLKFKMFCEHHGNFDSSVLTMKTREIQCPLCRVGGGYKTSLPGSLYILKIEGEGGNFTGYGISNQIEKRLQRHVSELYKYGYTITEQRIFNFSGKKTLAVESKIFHNFEICSQNISGFREEAVSSEDFDNLVNFVQTHSPSSETKLDIVLPSARALSNIRASSPPIALHCDQLS